jgi:hypothetical protein
MITRCDAPDASVMEKVDVAYLAATGQPPASARTAPLICPVELSNAW